MSGFLLAAILAAAQPATASAPPEDLPRRVVFARTWLDGWRIEAKTDVDTVGGFPIIENAYCEMKRSGLAITTWLDAGLWIRLGDDSVEPDLEFRPENIRRIGLDDRIWEYHWVRTGYDRDQFLNIAYPPPPDPCGGRRGHSVILYGCPGGVVSFNQGIRRRAGQPWLARELLANHFLRARMLRIGFQDPEQPEGRAGPLLWAEIPLTGLARAIAWCRGELRSEGARRLHGGLEEE
jgi:hypothetical protein